MAISSSSEYYNYKGYFSVVLLAFVDYDYRFLVTEVGGMQRRMQHHLAYGLADFEFFQQERTTF